MEYPIRPLDISKYDDIISLWSRAGLSHRPTGRDSREAMAAEFKRDETCFLGMYDGLKMIGVVIVTSDGRKGWINRMAVDPDYRGQGLAGKLIENCELFLQSKGIQIFACLIEDENFPSISAFKKAGYEPWPNIVYLSKRISKEV